MPSIKNFEDALNRLKQHDVVAVPTETVYGLAARIDSVKAIEKIFATKQRPFFDPLIVHVSSIEQAKQLTKFWPKAAQILAEYFWPGPLTIVLPKSDLVSDLITSGLSTVGIRMPNNKLTLKLINDIGTALAAPSANKFGKTSPTCVQHVKTEFNNEVFVLEDTDSQVGIESTIVILDEDSWTVARQGMITKSEIQNVFNNQNIKLVYFEKNKQVTPGSIEHHYMPEVPLIYFSNNFLKTKNLFQLDDEVLNLIQLEFLKTPDQTHDIKIKKPIKFRNFLEFTLDSRAELAARSLYFKLRDVSENKQLDFIYFCEQSYMADEQWSAIIERIYKASSLRF
jgi:L-threonylcarbamoyladenylate synthase